MTTLHLPLRALPAHHFARLMGEPRLFIRPIANTVGFLGVRTNFYPRTAEVREHGITRWTFTY